MVLLVMPGTSLKILSTESLDPSSENSRGLEFWGGMDPSTSQAFSSDFALGGIKPWSPIGPNLKAEKAGIKPWSSIGPIGPNLKAEKAGIKPWSSIGPIGPNPNAEKALKARPIRTYPCELCTRVFYVITDLKRHMRTHTGERPFPCLVCGRRFSQKQTMKRHWLTIHKTVPYVDAEGGDLDEDLQNLDTSALQLDPDDA